MAVPTGENEALAFGPGVGYNTVIGDFMNRSILSTNAFSIQHTPKAAVWMGALVCRYMAKRTAVVGRKGMFLS